MGTPRKLTLPSGRTVPLMSIGDPTRLWELEGTGDTFRLRRQRRGDSGSWEFYARGALSSHTFTKADAEALADELNAIALSRRAPRVCWVGKS